MTKAGDKILAGANEALELACRWRELARYADACIDLDLTPQQELLRLAMLRAMIEEITVEIQIEADAASERPRYPGPDLREGVREIKAGDGDRREVEVPKA